MTEDHKSYLGSIIQFISDLDSQGNKVSELKFMCSKSFEHNKNHHFFN